LRKDEAELVNDLKKSLEDQLETDPSPSRGLETSLSVLAMYCCLYRLSCREHLAKMPRATWSDEFLPVLVRMLLEPMEELAIMAHIESIGPISDSTSQLVQSQYEENPYPRWVAIPNSPKTNIRHALKLEFPSFVQPDFLQGPIRMLIAGCGTGRHPIQNALYLSKNHNIEILALDISRRSLSYAIRMARKYGVNNIEFMHGDILDVHNLNKRFHIIESQGVLHHMQHPIEGWRALTQVLEKDGLMSIGLYSKAARVGLAQIQDRFKQEGLTPDDDNIRKFRGRILSGEWKNIRFESPDFYSMSGCRDLLFHFNEHQYTTQLIESSLRELNLSFIGFTFEDLGTKHLYQKNFPQDSDMDNLSLWGEFENRFPNTFAKMYRFWCKGN
jgi:SAM-dependent methyltransferase